MLSVYQVSIFSVRRRSLRERDVSGHRSAGPQHVVPWGWDSCLKHTFSYFETSSIWSHGDGDMGTEEEGGRSRAHFECFWRRPSRERADTCWPFLLTKLTDSPCPQFHFDLPRQREGDQRPELEGELLGLGLPKEHVLLRSRMNGLAPLQGDVWPGHHSDYNKTYSKITGAWGSSRNHEWQCWFLAAWKVQMWIAFHKAPTCL